MLACSTVRTRTVDSLNKYQEEDSVIGLINWVRSFTYDKEGRMVRGADGPVFSAHPQPNLWTLLKANAKELSPFFDAIQLPAVTYGDGEGYSPQCLRNFNSNWGTKAELVAAIAACRTHNLIVSADLVYRQMNGENGGPGVFRYADGIGDTKASWFQYYGQAGESIPPFVKQDEVPDSSGNYAFGRVRSYQNCDPAGATEADTVSALKLLLALFEPLRTFPRFDDVKGMHAPSVLRIMNSAPSIPFYGEYFTGSTEEIDWYVATVMNYRCAVEDYPQYWHTQNACNQYDASLFDQGGYWQYHGGYFAVTFVNNPDVATSWSPTGGISQQIAFNLLLAYALTMCLPSRMCLVYAEDYYPASPDYPTGRGLMPFIDNMCWFARTFAYGGFERRWVDHDVYCYTRDGNGGSIGQNGGCLVVVNFNTYLERTITVQTMWPEGRAVHNYSYTGVDQDAYVGPGGMLTLTVQANYFSNGQSYQLWAQKGAGL